MGLDPRTETQLRLLADPEKRAIVSELEGEADPLHVEALAERLVARETTVARSSEYERQVEQTVIELHHDHLPKLAEADVVEYDVEANLVRYREPPIVANEWHEATTLDEIARYLHTGSEDEDGTMVLEGRQSIIDYGRQLADEAEDELFCMYARTDLLEEECIRRAKQALERDVSMYLGAQNPEVRELTRTELPGVTVWEPQHDLLNTAGSPRVGRLVFVDRRKVMLAILDEEDPEATHPAETAVIGEGETHPVVVLVRELLGRRLDHLDYQSVDFSNELPT